MNRAAWEEPEVVDYYVDREFLYGPEDVIASALRDQFKPETFLDIGVGTGRTTPFFAPLVGEYVGIDYSQKMIDVCRKKFAANSWNVRFCVGDVRGMNELLNEYFDFILFSYNGIDYINHEGRLAALSEIRRVLKKGGHFFFSAHNATTVRKMFSLQLNQNPGKWIRNLSDYFRLRRNNRTRQNLLDQDIVWFNDGAHDFRLLTYYIRPSRQIEQLREFGFDDVRVFELSGKELTYEELTSPDDKWLYYLAKLAR